MATLRPSILFLLLLLTFTAFPTVPTSADGIHVDAAAPFTTIDGDDAYLTSSMANFYDEYDEFDLDTDSGRRSLMARRRRFLSYDMLKRNRVPCNRRGVSYYNCYRHGRANPYRRGCSYITRCARDLR